MAAVRARGRHRGGPHRYEPAAAAPGHPGQAAARGPEAGHQHQREEVRDVAEHAGEVPGHAARVQREGLLLRGGDQRVLL